MSGPVPPHSSAVDGREPRGGLRHELGLLVRLARAYARGEYRDIATWTWVSLALAIIYAIVPFDAIPDWIPIAGILDDLGVVAWAVACVRGDLRRFEAWERGIDAREV